jgi:hypothetical protein
MGVKRKKPEGCGHRRPPKHLERSKQITDRANPPPSIDFSALSDSLSVLSGRIIPQMEKRGPFQFASSSTEGRIGTGSVTAWRFAWKDDPSRAIEAPSPLSRIPVNPWSEDDRAGEKKGPHFRK